MATYGDPPVPVGATNTDMNTTYQMSWNESTQNWEATPYTHVSNTTGVVTTTNQVFTNPYVNPGTHTVPNHNWQVGTNPSTPFVGGVPQTPWQPDVEVVPVFADAMTARANLQMQLELLQSFEEGLEGEVAARLSDAIYFLEQTIKELDEIIGD